MSYTNRVKVNATGTTTIMTLGSTIPSFASFTDRSTRVTILAEDFTWQVCTATISGNSLTINIVEENSAGTQPTLIDFTGKNLQIAETLTGTGMNILESHVADGTLHFTEGSIDHDNIQNIGTNSHADIDAFLSSTNNPSGVTLEQARTADNTLAGDVDFVDNSISNINEIEFNGGQAISWNPEDLTLNVPTGVGPTLQVGQEEYILVHNATGSTITNGTVVSRVDGSPIINGRATIAEALADYFDTCSGTIAIATMDILDGTDGFVTRTGTIRGIDTSMFSAGDVLYLSDVTTGALTNVRPKFPSYPFRMGLVISAHLTTGSLSINVNGQIENTFTNFWNGVTREHFQFLVTSDGAIVTGALSPSGTQEDLTLTFSDGLHIFDTTPDATIQMIPGTDTVLAPNYVFIPIDTKVLTVNTTGFPAIEHIKIAGCILRSAATTQTDGALTNQNVNDGVQASNGQGHLSHITERLRKEGARWDSGTEGTLTIDNGPTPDSVTVAVTSGSVYQLHKQAYPALDMATGEDIHIVNHPITPYVGVLDLNTQLVDAVNVSLNNTSFSFVVWGVVGKDTSSSHFMLNLPTGSYSFNDSAGAITDPNNYAVYDIPEWFNGTGFLIARYVMTYKNNDWVLVTTEDLRGSLPNTSAGGGLGGSGVTTYLGLTDTGNSYLGFATNFPQVNVGETALEFTAPNTAFNKDFGAIADTVCEGDDSRLSDSRDPNAHTHVEVDITDLDKYTQTEVDAADNLRLKAKGLWVQSTYQLNDYVRDGIYTGYVINAAGTDERLAPQNIGSLIYAIDETEVPTTAQSTSVVKMVHKYSVLKTGFIEQIYVRLPEWTPDAQTKITLINHTLNTVTVINNPLIGTADEWVLVKAGSLGVHAGDESEAWFEYYNTAPSARINGGWTSNLGTGAPSAQSFNIDNLSTPTSLVFSHTDLDGSDRTAEMQGVSVDSIINLNETSDTSRSVEVKVTVVDITQPTYTTYTVTVIANGSKDIRNGVTCTVSIDIPVSQPTVYPVFVDYLDVDPSWANIASELYYGDALQADVNDAYGINLGFQEAYVSPDWFISAMSGSGSSSGDSGGTVTIVDDLVTQDANKALSANMGYVLDQKKLEHTNGVSTGLYETTITTPVLDIDVSAANVQTKTISADSTFTFSGWTADAGSVILELTAAGTEVITWTGVTWAGGTAPEVSPFMRFVFTSVDAGVTVRGSIIEDVQA